MKSTYDLQIFDISSDDIDNSFVVTIYGKTIDNKDIIVHITDFKPFFYVKIPELWNSSTVNNQFIPELKRKYKLRNNIDIGLPQYYKDFYGYNINYENDIQQYKFIKLTFNNYRDFSNTKKILIQCFKDPNNSSKIIEDWRKIAKDGFEANLYEANLNPMIRFIHHIKINPSGWIRIDIDTDKGSNDVIEDIDSMSFKASLEMTCISKNIIPLDKNDISNYIIASYDIECDSSHGDFPLPTKDMKKLAMEIYNIYFNETIHDIYLDIDWKEKKELIKNIINYAFTGKNEFTEDLIETHNVEINRIYTENGLPTEKSINNLELLSEEFIDRLDNIKNYNKCRDTLIKEYIIPDLNTLKNKKYNNIIIKGDPIIQIGTVFYNYGTGEIKRNIIVIKPDNKDEEICDDLENIEVIKANSEKELLIEWCNVINEYNPDFITGYNILGFDFNYIYERVNYLFKSETEKNMFYNFGRLKYDCDKYKQYYYKKCKLIKQNLSSAAFGDNELIYINMDGRIIFDIQKEIQKAHNLESYKLDNVSAHFMRGNIYTPPNDYDLPYKNKYPVFIYPDKIVWILFTNNLGHLKKGDYITINIQSNIGEFLLFNGKKFKILSLDKSTYSNKMIQLDISDYKNILEELQKFKIIKMEWCLNKDDVSPQEIFNLHKNGGPSGRAKVAKYCIQDCELCINLLLLLDIIPNFIGMSSVCLVPLSYIFTRGQGIKVSSIVFNECSKHNTLIPTLKQNFIKDGGYEGAVVLDPNPPGIYLDDPIAVLDYASLYPSSIIENNLSHETYVTNLKYVEKFKKKYGIDKFNQEFNTIKFVNYKYIKKGKSDTFTKIIDEDEPEKTCYFKNNKLDENKIIDKKSMGIIPTICNHLLDARKNTKKLLKNEKNEFKRKILDGLQLAYKVTCNSVYGQMGARTSTIYLKDIAACTTSIGRQRIDDASDGVIRWAKHVGYEKPEIIYGDTDSVFVKFSRKDLDGNEIKDKKELLKHCIQCGIDSGIYINESLKDPQNLEYEKTFFPFILLSKKRYIGDKYEWIQDVENNNYKRTSMGIVMKRRDNAPIVKYVYGNMIEKIMIEKNFQESLKWLINTLEEITNGGFDMNMFIITKSLRADYKNPLSIAHKVLADRMGERDPGNKPKSNDRIPFLYVIIKEIEKVFDLENKYKSGKNKGKPRKKSILQGDRVEHPVYIIENKLDIDYSFYITNQIMKPILQLLELDNTFNNSDDKYLFDKYIINDEKLYKRFNM
jgi:DNA polymerase elongation subunit (family B)